MSAEHDRDVAIVPRLHTLREGSMMIKMIAGDVAHSVAHRTVERTEAGFPRSLTLRIQFDWNISRFATAPAFR